MKGFIVLVFVFTVVLTQNAVDIENDRCNSKQLAAIMKRSMSPNIEQSRDAISNAAKSQIGGDFGVICSQDDIASAISPTELFCEARLGDVVCLAFKRG